MVKVNQNKDINYYQKRYKSIQDRKQSFFDKLKGKALRFITEKQILANKFAYEYFSYNKKEWIIKDEIFLDNFNDVQFNKVQAHYNNITLESICFYDVVEIDNFDDFRRKVVNKFGNINDTVFSLNNKLKDKIKNVENKTGVSSIGSLFYIDYSKRRKSKNDLIETVNCRFIKTEEAYFILAINVSLSDTAKSIFKNLVSQEEAGFEKINYNTFIDIIKKKRFYSSISAGFSIKNEGIKNLISDINQQVISNITNHFKGFFYKKFNKSNLPHLEFYEVDDIYDFNQDQDLKSIFFSDFGKYYSLEDKQIELYLSDISKNNIIQVIKQKGHGARINKSHDLSNYDSLESQDIINSLSFPCAFSAILSAQTEKLNNLKQEVYYLIKSKRFDFFRKINPFKNFFDNIKYVKCKKKIIKLALTIQRFETETKNRSFHFYSSQFNLNRFLTRNSYYKNDYSNLESRFLKEFNLKITQLSNKTRDLNEVFKPIEELQSYKTNIFLQIISLLIAIIAFVFAFDKTKKVILDLIDLIFK